MGNIRKAKKRRFGLPSGRFTLQRQAAKVFSGRTKKIYICKSGEGLCLNILKKRSLTVFMRNRINLLRKNLTKSSHKIGKKYCSVQIETPASGYRIIELNNLQEHYNSIATHAILCERAKNIALRGGKTIELMSQSYKNGMAVTLIARCTGCHHKFSFDTSPTLHANATRHYDVNVRAVWGALASGNGLAHVNEFMSTLDSPSLTQKSFSTIEKSISAWWKDLLHEDFSAAIAEEKKIAIEKGNFHEGVPSIIVICDGGWSKRSHKHTYNALGGVGVIIGAETKKLLHVGIRNKYCYICNRANTLGTEPKEHNCFKNWQGSSQSMESDIIVEGFLKANDHGVRYMNVIADGDSSVYAHIQEKAPIWGKHVQKIECANHVCKCLRSNLEKLVDSNPSYKGKGKLTKQIRVRIVSAVRCAIRMRSAETNKKEAATKLEHIMNTLSHIYGEHSRCSEFCKAKSPSKIQNPSTKGQEEEDDNTENIFQSQSSFWSEGTSFADEEMSRNDVGLNVSHMVDEMRQDVALILNYVARKSKSLLGNATSNLAEMWMHIRTKYDGGKMYNHCNRGSWHTRCYAASLRMNKVPCYMEENNIFRVRTLFR